MKRSQNLLTACAAALVTSTLIAVATQAATVNYQFSGLMNDPFGTYPIGTPFSGSISYVAPQANIGSPTVGHYLNQTFTLTVGSDTVADSGTGDIYVYDNVVTPYPTDLMIVSASNVIGMIGGLTLSPSNGLQLALQDVTGNAFSGIGLPGPGLSLSEFTPGNATFIQITDASFNHFARGDLGLLAAPEPSGQALLLGGGAMSLVGLTRARRRSCRPCRGTGA